MHSPPESGMRARSVFLLFLLVLMGWGVLRAQRPFKAYRGQEYEDFPLPPDWQKTAEWTRARLHYPSFLMVHPGARDGYDRWTIDYPRSDRHLLQGIRRLTRIDTRSVEQVVDLDGDRRRLQLAVHVRRRGRLLESDRRASRRNCGTTCCAAASSCATIFTAPWSGTTSPPA